MAEAKTALTLALMLRYSLLYILLLVPTLLHGKTADEAILELSKQIDRADQMVVYSEGFKREFVIYRSTKRQDLDDLKAAISLTANGEGGICACVDGPEIALLIDGQEIATVWNHEGTGIGSSAWEGEWETSDPERWLHWFDVRGINFPRQWYETTGKERKKEADDEQRWMSAMPSSVRPLWDDINKQLYSPPINSEALEPVNAALRRQFPDQKDRILALLFWFGSDAGPWSGYPGYEEVPARLLTQYSPGELISAAESAQLNEEQIEGASRIFGAWSSNDSRAQLPSDLKRMFFEHCSKVKNDDDKLERCRKAFSDP